MYVCDYDAFLQCHGSEDGVPMHPRMPCGCKKSGKMYRDCCFKRKHYWRETLTDYNPPPTFIDHPVAAKAMKANSRHSS